MPDKKPLREERGGQIFKTERGDLFLSRVARTALVMKERKGDSSVLLDFS